MWDSMFFGFVPHVSYHESRPISSAFCVPNFRTPSRECSHYRLWQSVKMSVKGSFFSDLSCSSDGYINVRTVQRQLQP